MSQAPKLTYFDSCLRFKDKRFHAFLLKNSVLLQGMAGAAALAVAVLARQWLEASMWRHMVLQFPLLLLAGAAWAGALPPAWQGRSINQYGITGWVAASSILAVLMIPRVLDLALLRPEVEVAKCTALVLAGLALRLSWQPAGRVLQFFFLGNLLAMTAIVGLLYIDSPLRLCNAYLQDDQIRLGQWLVGISSTLGLAWLGTVTHEVMQREQQQQPPAL